jgi:hypothetical protein
MKDRIKQSCLMLIVLASCSEVTQEISYPISEKIGFSETLHGYQIQDEYRWLEDFTSDDSKNGSMNKINLHMNLLEKINLKALLERV